ncbi:MAG TPA: enoyl-CoA hydratase-related protein [Polyangia bacterium]|jgi:enoyl-CoA hydratase|nr:enoyl-CoA hydratase-related protein [Polyangia bacterium]
MTEPLVQCQDAAGPIATVTVDRPQAMNALNAPTLELLRETFAALASAPGVRCVILTGAGEKAFVAGADIKAMESLTSEQARALAELGHAVGDAIEALPAPVIAAVNGFALGGGCELALACDFVHAAQTARFGQPEVNLGIIPGFGGTQRLARRVGIGRARELIYSGRVIDADEALRIGLVNGVHPPAELLSRVRAIAESIAAKAPLAVTEAKRAIRQGADRPLSEAHAIERRLFAGLFDTADRREGMRAFVEKRPPKWTAR